MSELRGKNAHFAVYTSVSVVLQIITTLALSARIYVRRKLTRTFAKDDTMLIVAHTFNTVANIIWLDSRVKSTKYPPGSLELFQALIARSWIGISLYVTAGILSKIAIAMFFLRMARRRLDRWIVLTPLGIYISALSISMTVILFRCGLPLMAIKILRDETCPIGSRVIEPLGYMMATLCSVCDLTFSILPIQLLRKARSMSRFSKTSAYMVVGVANIGTIVSIIKIPFIRGSTLGPNTFENSAPAFILSTIETAVGITAISLACLKPLLRVLCIGSSSPRSASPIVTSADQQRSDKSGNPSRIKSVQIDSQVLGGIGVLPNSMSSTLRMGSFHDERNDSSVVELSRQAPQRSTNMMKGTTTITEILYSADERGRK
ncbi:hypothetical protein BDZ85DRAFT_109831 [Elsinoe ampelina]|uniref:Rhodopsin domain-containing protein n=1 Tax=Elsinoe ampelina TaxID=302913 RepID=A0A6A6GCL8_9PEZI|nr:hypothetical protein BDZ85DRAFT_109831 [Elsinoe ampelina]